MTQINKVGSVIFFLKIAVSSEINFCVASSLQTCYIAHKGKERGTSISLSVH